MCALSKSGRLLPFFLIFLASFLLPAGCSTRSAPPTSEEGRIILWHTWAGVEEEALQTAISRFGEAYPNIRVISISFAEDELEREFSQKVNQGLGPDLLVGPQMWTPILADEGLIRSLDAWDTESSDFAASAALDTLTYRERTYGIPLSQQTYGLYYNLGSVDTPPSTLDELLEQAEGGLSVGIDTTFESAFWGVRAFGGELLDESGRIVLNQGGFANWLEWLLEAQNTPNMITSDDQQLLLKLFESGDLDYYVGKSSDLLHFQETMGRDLVGVSPLPSGPTDSAGPFLTTEALYFSTASSPLQAERAMLLAEFLTNAEQQRKLAQETGRIPANPSVRIDRRITPAVAAFSEQAKSATPLLLLPQVSDVIERGREVYVQALEGLMIPADAADMLTVAINAEYGLDSLQTIAGDACLVLGELEVWHSWSGEAEAVLNNLATDFNTRCTNAEVTLTYYPPKSIADEFERSVLSTEEPDLMLINSDQIAHLAESGAISSLEDQADAAFLQRYVPGAPSAMHHLDQLFGIPLTMQTEALYYNNDLVSEPPYDLNDLVNQVGPNTSFVMAYTPYEITLWGMGAFGGQLFDTGGNLAINQDGVAEWLTWLQESSDELGMVLVRDDQEAQDLFAGGEAAYYMGNSNNLTALQARLGDERVGIVPLPAGPEGNSSPILTVDGFVTGPNRDEEKTLAGEFVRFMTAEESQRHLMLDANLVPANINVEDVQGAPAIAGFMAQAGSAIVLEDLPELATIIALGDRINEQVIEERLDPVATLDDFTSFLLRSHADPAVSTVEPVCGGEEGELIVWHSLEGLQEQVLEQIVVRYAQSCPGISINLNHVPEADLPNLLVASSTEASSEGSSEESLPAPDLILAAHDLIVPLSQEQLIKPISNLIDGSTLIPYFSQSLAPLHHEGAIYGLPYAQYTDVLFYNEASADEPPFTLDALFTTATADTPFAIETDFLNGFWGTSGHNPDLHTDAEAISSGEQSLVDVFQKGLGDWLKKLQVVQNRPGIVLSQDANQLSEIFLTEKATYLAADSSALPILRAEMIDAETGLTKLGVAALPKGPTGPSAPLLRVDSLLFSASSDEDQSRLALNFAEFATSGPSQALLMSEAAGVPANALALTLVDDPQIEEIVRQTGASIPLPPRSEVLILQEYGDALYRSILDEMQPPTAAVNRFLAIVAEAPRPAVVAAAVDSDLTCVDEGALSIWYSPWSDAEGGAADFRTEQPLEAIFPQLAEIIDSFETVCPAVTVELELVPSSALPERLAEAADSDTLPDLVLGRNVLIGQLAERGLIQPVTDSLPEEFPDRYQAGLTGAVEYDGALYGIPAAMSTVALYYNRDLVEGGAAQSLEDLLESASPEKPAAINTDFRSAYWGISAFGNALVGPDGQISPDQNGALAWLEWLQANQDNPNLLLSEDGDELARLFADEQLSYLIDGPDRLAHFREELGEKVRVIGLPAGPTGMPGPLLNVDAILFTSKEEGTGTVSESTEPESEKSDEKAPLGMIFANFLTSAEMQALLLESGGYLPVHRIVNAATSDPAAQHFTRMAAELGVVLPPELDADLNEAGANLYSRVLTDGEEPNDALNDLLDAMGIVGTEE